MNKKRILIIDDDPAILDALQLMLEESGYDAETSIDGKAAFGMREAPPDAILLDIWMSGTDGRDICKHLKSRIETRHIPVIIVSANKDTEKIAKEAGADDFLAKPFDMKNLLHKLETCLSGRQGVLKTPDQAAIYE